MNICKLPLAFTAAMATALLAAGAASAQDKPDRKDRIEQFNKRFAEADTNSDGRLTREEAQGKMPYVASHFDEIDADKKGYVTKADVAKMLKKMAPAKSQ